MPFAEVVVAPPKTSWPPMYTFEVLALPVKSVRPLKVVEAREEEMVVASVPTLATWRVEEAEA